MVGGDISAIVVAVSVTIVVFLAISARRAVVFARSLSPIADDAVAVSAPAPTARGRQATIRWVMGAIAWIALILVVDWALIFAPRPFVHEALLWTNLGVAVAALSLAILLSRRLSQGRLLAKRYGTTTVDVDTVSRGRISLVLSLAGIILLVGGLLLILVFGDLGRFGGAVPKKAGYEIFLCILLCLIVELVAFGSGIASRGRATGIAGLVISGVLLLLVGLPTVLWFIGSAEDFTEPITGPILELCPFVVSVTTLVFLALAARRVAGFERSLRVMSDEGDTAFSASAPTGLRRGVTIVRLMSVIAGAALTLGLFRILLDSDPDLRWFTDGGFLLVYLSVALPTLGFAVLLSQRTKNHRQMFRLAVKHP
jgi:hypothetical protein